MARNTIPIALSVMALILASSVAQAHTGVGSTAGFGPGFGHPFSGLDHILAMFAVGLFAARLGGKALWAVPAAFVTMMALGGVLGIAGIGLPYVETGIAASVIVLGGVVALQAQLPVAMAMGLVGFFAIFHGHAHGAEMPADASGMTYALGFILATALLHATGIAIALGIGTVAQKKTVRISQIAGGAMTLAGFGILTGLV